MHVYTFPKTLKPKSNPLSEMCGRVEAAVTAALLHDVVDDTPVALEDVAARFGERIAGIVAQVSQLSNTNQLLRRQRRKQARAPPADPAFRPHTHRLHAAFEQDRVHARCLCRRTYLSSMQRLVWWMHCLCVPCCAVLPESHELWCMSKSHGPADHTQQGIRE